jgi:hypothetical protein
MISAKQGRKETTRRQCAPKHYSPTCFSCQRNLSHSSCYSYHINPIYLFEQTNFGYFTFCEPML